MIEQAPGPLPRTTGPWPARLHRAGSLSLAVIGVGHLLAVHLLAAPPPPGEREIAELSARVTSPLLPGGLARTVLELNTGYSVGLAAALLAFGLVCWAAVRHAPQLADRPTGFTVLCLLTALGLFALSVTSFPEPPIVLTALSVLCYASALVLAARGAREPVAAGR